MELLTHELILFLLKHVELFMENYQAIMTLRKVQVELIVNQIVKVEEVVQKVNIVAKNMGRVNAKIKIKGKQYVDERFVSRVSHANVAVNN